MKKKFKIIDASTGIAGGKPLKLKEGEMLVMNDQGIFFMVGNLMDYGTYVRKLSDVCPRFDVEWVGEN